MKNLVIISTVGASLLTNYARYVKADPHRFLDSIDSLSENELKSLEKSIIEYLLSLGDRFIEASAELNSIMDILRTLDISAVKEIELMFVISDTKQGQLIAEVLMEFINRHIKKFCDKDLKVYYDVIEGLNYKDIEHATKGLPLLAARIATWIKNKKSLGHEVILNITGGFKAESIFVAMVGLLARIPVYYMHEKFRKAIRLPPLVTELSGEYEILLEIIKSFYDSYVRSD